MNRWDRRRTRRSTMRRKAPDAWLGRFDARLHWSAKVSIDFDDRLHRSYERLHRFGAWSPGVPRNRIRIHRNRVRTRRRNRRSSREGQWSSREGRRSSHEGQRSSRELQSKIRVDPTTFPRCGTCRVERWERAHLSRGKLPNPREKAMPGRMHLMENRALGSVRNRKSTERTERRFIATST